MELKKLNSQENQWLNELNRAFSEEEISTTTVENTMKSP
jgi:hypothetical protein